MSTGEEKTNSKRTCRNYTTVAKSATALKAFVYANLIAQGGSSIQASSIEGKSCKLIVDDRKAKSILDFLAVELGNPESRYYKEFCLCTKNPEEIITEAKEMTCCIE